MTGGDHASAGCEQPAVRGLVARDIEARARRADLAISGGPSGLLRVERRSAHELFVRQCLVTRAVGTGPGQLRLRRRKLRLAPVTLGAFGEDRVPVLSGLQASDWIVAAGGHLLRDGQRVAPVDRDNRPVRP